MIPEKLRKELSKDSYYKKCSRKEVFNDHECQGRIRLEHSLIYGGRQIQERWAIVPLCEFAHSVDNFQDGGILNKEKNLYIALSRATIED